MRPPSSRSATLVLTFGLVLAPTGCSSAPAAVPLAELASEQEAWDGREVVVHGTVRSFDDPLHYWVEDADAHRVELVPHDGLDVLVGHEVVVEGRFTFREGEGRRLQVARLSRLD
jgi:hypothetical protein